MSWLSVHMTAAAGPWVSRLFRHGTTAAAYNAHLKRCRQIHGSFSHYSSTPLLLLAAGVPHCTTKLQVLLRRNPTEVPELYLGLLYPTEEYRVYGYISNTHIKFVLVLDEAAPRDEELKRLFKRLHSLFVDVTCNPLYTHGLPITSRKFDEGVLEILRTYSS